MSGRPPLNYPSFQPGSNPDSSYLRQPKAALCYGSGWGEDRSLKKRISQEEHERGRSRCFQRTVTVVTTEVHAALTEVTRANAAIPSGRRMPPPSPGTMATTVIRSPCRGIKRVAGGKAVCTQRLKAGGLCFCPGASGKRGLQVREALSRGRID